MGYILVLTFMVSGMEPSVHHETMRCPDLACVHNVEAHASESRQLSRLRVWSAPEFAMIGLSKQFVWPPFIDEQYQ